MGSRLLAIFLAAAPLLMGQAPHNPPSESDPRYDSTTSVDIIMIVETTRDVANGSPLAGTHLFARPETAKEGKDILDVYLGPADFIKGFGVTFAKGDRIHVFGSKVKFDGRFLILAKEVRRDSVTLYLRDAQGKAYWKE